MPVGSVSAFGRQRRDAAGLGMQPCVRGSRAELGRLEKMSRLIRAAERPEMPREVLDRLHRSVDLQPRITMLHVAEVCAAIAASILLVSTVWLWRVSAAREAGPIPLWETAAVAPQDPSGVAAQEQLAQWIVQDLSRKNGHD